MHPESRRAFLKTACAASAGLAARASVSSAFGKDAASGSMPQIRLGKHPVSRLVLGANPMWGYSYQGALMSRFMVDYFTDDRIVKLLHDSERAGINTFQTNVDKRFPNVWRRYRAEGGKMQLVILYHPKEVTVKEAVQLSPIAIVHHGGVTDTHWRGGKLQVVRDFVREVKVAGVLAGVSSHRPEVIDQIVDEDWENDLFMACFFAMSRTEAEWKKILGFRPIQTTFLPADPERMCQSIRKAGKPCLAFKILAGGWGASNAEQTGKSFLYAFQNIKPSDGVIVGMLPAFTDQVSENVRHTIEHGSSYLGSDQ